MFVCCLAKNVILGGVKSVTLHDTESAQLAELSSQVCVYVLGVVRSLDSSSLKFSMLCVKIM